jgi:hypothetical protein
MVDCCSCESSGTNKNNINCEPDGKAELKSNNGMENVMIQNHE